MKPTLLAQTPSNFSSSLLAVFAVDSAEGKDAAPDVTLLTSDGALNEAAKVWLATGEFKAGLAETLLLHAPAGMKAERLLVIGLGKAKSLSVHEVRKGAGTAVRFAKPRGIREVAIVSPESTLDAKVTMRALVEGAVLADFEIDIYRSDRKDTSVSAVSVLVASKDSEVEAGFAEGVVIGEAQNFARSLVNEPGNVLTPTELGKRAKAMCDANGIACEVHSTAKMQELGMGAFLAVAQGSSEAPALIVMNYIPDYGEPEVAPAADAPVLALVGKGITFDTGGISIKPADNMDKMKYDMAGAAAMIGAMQVIAQLKPKVRVMSIVCSCENMPDGKAFKPGDVVTAMSGKTIEIMNTDATGAIGVALGKLNAGLFSNDDATVEKFMEGYGVAGEKFWRMPCTDDYREQIRSAIADIMNTGNSRYGGATTAAMFLKEFAGETPWIHLDIAGTAWLDENSAWMSKGPSGVAVRSIAEWVSSYSA